MEGKRGRVNQRIMLLCDIKTNETYEMIKRRVLNRESLKETGCLEPALEQNTNDDEVHSIYSHFIYSTS